MNQFFIPTIMLMLIVTCGTCCYADTSAQKGRADAMVQAGMVLTVAESKRLIAKAVVEMPIVKPQEKRGAGDVH